MNSFSSYFVEKWIPLSIKKRFQLSYSVNPGGAILFFRFDGR